MIHSPALLAKIRRYYLNHIEFAKKSGALIDGDVGVYVNTSGHIIVKRYMVTQNTLDDHTISVIEKMDI